jgi:hypothetical protein
MNRNVQIQNQNALVDLAGGSASFTCAGPEADLEKIRETVRDLGFEAD